MADFSQYGGPSGEWLAIQATLPTGSTDEDVKQLQQAGNTQREALAAKEFAALAPEIIATDCSIPARDGIVLEARLYRPKRLYGKKDCAIYIHFHGGGFLLGSLSSEDAICSRAALSASVLVLNVNYRHTPDYTYPTPWNDAEDAIAWCFGHVGELGGESTKIVVGGISAGAWLTASTVLQQHLSLALRDFPKIAGQVLMIPCLGHLDSIGPQKAKMARPDVFSHEQNKDAPILPFDRMKLFTELLHVQRPQEDDLRLNPGNAQPSQVRGSPPSVFGIAGYDPLRDEGLLYAQMLAQNSVSTNVHLFRGVPHGFRRFGDKLSASERWDRVVADGIKWILSDPDATEFRIQSD